MSILVTGASGFLGSHIAEALTRAGHDVVALVRPTSNTRCLESLTGVRLVRGTIEDRASVISAAKGVTGIIHAAGLTKARSPSEFLYVNTEGTENLIDASASSYGVFANGGQGEDTVFGSSFDDLINGGSGNDLLCGNAGNDVFYSADMQHDRIIGGAGIDVAFVDLGEAGVWGVEYMFYV